MSRRSQRDGVVPDDEVLGADDDFDAVLMLYFFCDHSGRWENAGTCPSEFLHQRFVVKLADDTRLDLVLAEPAAQ